MPCSSNPPLFLAVGTTFTASVVLRDNSGNPYNLVSSSFYSLARRTYGAAIDGMNGVQLSASIVQPFTSGTFQLALAPSDSLGLSGSYIYDALWTNTSGSNWTTRILSGTINASLTVS